MRGAERNEGEEEGGVLVKKTETKPSEQTILFKANVTCEKVHLLRVGYANETSVNSTECLYNPIKPVFNFIIAFSSQLWHSTY